MEANQRAICAAGYVLKSKWKKLLIVAKTDFSDLIFQIYSSLQTQFYAKLSYLVNIAQRSRLRV